MRGSGSGSVKLTISMPRSLLEEVKRLCREQGYSTSEFVREAVRRLISEKRRGDLRLGA